MPILNNVLFALIMYSVKYNNCNLRMDDIYPIDVSINSWISRAQILAFFLQKLEYSFSSGLFPI